MKYLYLSLANLTWCLPGSDGSRSSKAKIKEEEAAARSGRWSRAAAVSSSLAPLTITSERQEAKSESRLQRKEAKVSRHSLGFNKYD